MKIAHLIRDNSFSRSVRIFSFLMRRNFMDIRTRIFPLFIDGIILVAVDLFLISQLFPLFNIDTEFFAPLFVADSFILLLFIQGDTFCSRMRMDVISNQFIFYHLTLPIHWGWIFISYALSFVIEILIISLPVMTGGIFFLKQYVANIDPTWHLFVLHYTASLIFIATFFLFVVFRYHYSWIENNLWPRRLLPMFSLGATNTTWYQVLSFSPFLAYIGLCNPLTYFAEGFRASLLVGEYIPFSLSLSMIFLFSLGNIYLLLSGIKKQIDPVS